VGTDKRENPASTSIVHKTLQYVVHTAFRYVVMRYLSTLGCLSTGTP
jgi:hypothetical protein